MAIKVKKINEDGIEIVKEIEDDLYSAYVNIGWEKVEEKKPKSDIFKQIKKEIKVEKENESDI